MFTIKMVDGGFRSATVRRWVKERKGKGKYENGKLLFQSDVKAEMRHYDKVPEYMEKVCFTDYCLYEPQPQPMKVFEVILRLLCC